MHLIILKWLRLQKCRQKIKTMRQRGQSKRRNCQQKCNKRSHKYFCFFFNINSLHCFLWFLLYYLQHLLTSDRWSNFKNVLQNLKEQTKQGSAFLEYLKEKILKFLNLTQTIVASLSDSGGFNVLLLVCPNAKGNLVIHYCHWYNVSKNKNN